jgi:hypothetical protein
MVGGGFFKKVLGGGIEPSRILGVISYHKMPCFPSSVISLLKVSYVQVNLLA